MKDGHLNKCKDCTKKDSNKHRYDNIEYVKEYDRVRGQTETRKNKVKDHALYMKTYHTEKWRKMRYDAVKKNRLNNRNKYLANSRLKYAVRTGKVKKETCRICGALKSQGHHANYSKPLEVVWLCDYHHKEEHKKIREEKRNNDNEY
jgi:hypothetical protein